MKKRWPVVGGGVAGKASRHREGQVQSPEGGKKREEETQEANGSEGQSSGQGGCPGPQRLYWERVTIPSATGRGFSWGWGVLSERWLCSQVGGRKGQGGARGKHSTLHPCARTWAPSEVNT